MCRLSVEMLTFPALLEDPMIRMMMDCDGVSEGELRQLMSRMRDIVVTRMGPIEPARALTPSA